MSTQVSSTQISKSYKSYQIVVDRGAAHTDQLDVLVEAPPEIYGDRNRLARLEKRLRYEVRGALGIKCNVKLVGPRKIERSEGKALRVVDKRTV